MNNVCNALPKALSWRAIALSVKAPCTSFTINTSRPAASASCTLDFNVP